MTPEHPQWRKFCDYLSGPEGIDLQVEGEDISGWKWTSEGMSLTKSENIFRKHFPDIDVPRTLQYFKQHGGYTDFEVLMNIGWEITSDFIIQSGNL